MQDTSASMTTALDARNLAAGSYALAELIEIYAYDYVPGVGGFDPNDAEQRFCSVEGLTFLSLAYQRYYTGRGDVRRFFGKNENGVTANFSNAEASRYVAEWVNSEEVEGKQFVVRVIDPTNASAVLADSLVILVARLEKPGDFDDGAGSLSAADRYGQTNLMFPSRTFSPNDPKGRAPNDPKFEGFRFLPVSGSLQYTVRERRTSGFGVLLGLSHNVTKSLQYSSHSNFESQMVVPDAFGRVQARHIYLATIDIGGAINISIAFLEGTVADYDSVRQLNPKFSQPRGLVLKYGYPGGSGIPGRVQQPVLVDHPGFNVPGDGYYSHTAWAHCSVIGSTPDIDEAEAPDFAAVIKAKIVKVPDGSGSFVTDAWSHSPVAIARYLLADERYFNEGDTALEDAVNYETYLHCLEPVLDTSQGERAVIPAADEDSYGTDIIRYNSTGIINARGILQGLGTLTGDRFLSLRDSDDILFPDPTDPPATIAPVNYLRERYTCNVTLTEKVSAIDFLYDTIAPTGRLYFVRNGKGRIEIRSERPADSTRLRGDSVSGATTIKVLDVEPWRASLARRLLVGNGLTTSEVRNVTAANYTADGNAVTLAASKTGGVTATASGATLSGGSSSVAATGTVTIGGTPAAGNTVTITVGGLAVTYTLDSFDTTVSVAAMLCYLIQATPKLREMVKASWSSGSSVVTLASRYGVLTLDAALTNAHSGVVASPTSAPSASAAAGGSPPAGTVYLAYANRNANGATALSPVTGVAVTAGQKLSVSALALPAGITSRDWYVSKYSDHTELVFHSNTNGSAFFITDLPDSSNDLPPYSNTTGEELLRVAMAFASGDQDPYPVWSASTPLALNDIILPTTPNGHKYKVTTAGITGTTEPTYPTTSGATVTNNTVVLTEFGATILGQAGLTKGNIHRGTFKSPLGGKQSSVNQVIGTFYDAADDYASTPLEVNDYGHQIRTRKTNKKELDLSGFDNYHQASRHLNFVLSKNREGDSFAEWQTNPYGMLLEEGDVVCVSSANFGHVNYAVRIEELSIGAPPPQGHFDVKITARKYSTLMFSDQVRQHSIKIPTTLKHTTVLDTELQILDLPTWRESESEEHYIQVAIRRADGVGDWRGSQLRVDAGDDYKQIASIDNEATTGTAVTDLPTSQSFVWDNTLTVRVTVDALRELTSATDDELFAGANLARIGGSIFRFKTATVFDAVTNTYDLTGLQIGLFGTELSTGLTGDGFTLLDANVISVKADLAWLDREVNFKAVTLRQGVADATAHPFTWQGQSERALPPSNFVARTDTDGDTLLEFDLRGNGRRTFRDLSSVSVQPRRAELKLTDALGAAKDRPPLTIIQGMALAAALVDTSATGGGDTTKNSITLGGTASNAVSLQEMRRTGNFVEATLFATDNGRPTVGLLSSEIDFRTATFESCIYAVQLNVSGAQLDVYQYGVSVATITGAATGARVRILLSGTEARFYVNYVGAGSVPVYVSPLPPRFPLRAFVSVGRLFAPGTASVTGVTMTCDPDMKTIYSAAQRAADGGGTAYGKLYEISPTGLKGQELTVTF